MGKVERGANGQRIYRHFRNSRVPCICQVRTAYVFRGETCIGEVTEEKNDADEFDWVFKVYWDKWEEVGSPDISGYNLDLRLDEYIRRYVPAFVDSRTLPDTRDRLHETLQQYGLTWNDRFEYMRRQRGVCGDDDYYIGRTPNDIIKGMKMRG